MNRILKGFLKFERDLPERRIHVLPQACNQAHLSVGLLTSGEALDVGCHVIAICGKEDLKWLGIKAAFYPEF